MPNPSSHPRPDRGEVGPGILGSIAVVVVLLVGAQLLGLNAVGLLSNVVDGLADLARNIGDTLDSVA